LIRKLENELKAITAVVKPVANSKGRFFEIWRGACWHILTSGLMRNLKNMKNGSRFIMLLGVSMAMDVPFISS